MLDSSLAVDRLRAIKGGHVMPSSYRYMDDRRWFPVIKFKPVEDPARPGDPVVAVFTEDVKMAWKEVENPPEDAIRQVVLVYKKVNLEPSTTPRLRLVGRVIPKEGGRPGSTGAEPVFWVTGESAGELCIIAVVPRVINPKEE